MALLFPIVKSVIGITNMVIVWEFLAVAVGYVMNTTCKAGNLIGDFENGTDNRK